MAMAFVRMARQRHLVGPALLAASTIAFVPRATVCRGSDRFFASQQGGNEDDVARLRRENAELKSKLARQKEPSESGGFLEGLFFVRLAEAEGPREAAQETAALGLVLSRELAFQFSVLSA